MGLGAVDLRLVPGPGDLGLTFVLGLVALRLLLSLGGRLLRLGLSDLGVALDRDMPMQTALGLASPVALVPTTKGPPHVGTSGWLFHLDAPNLLLTTLRPGPQDQDSITARMLECSLHGNAVEFRCARNPKRAMLVNARGETLLEATINGDAVQFEAAPGDLIHLRVEFI